MKILTFIMWLIFFTFFTTISYSVDYTDEVPCDSTFPSGCKICGSYKQLFYENDSQGLIDNFIHQDKKNYIVSTSDKNTYVNFIPENYINYNLQLYSNLAGTNSKGLLSSYLPYNHPDELGLFGVENFSWSKKTENLGYKPLLGIFVFHARYYLANSNGPYSLKYNTYTTTDTDGKVIYYLSVHHVTNIGVVSFSNYIDHEECYKAYGMYCGDGVKNGPEQCDPNDPTHNGWGSLGCSSDCKALNPEVPSGGGGSSLSTNGDTSPSCGSASGQTFDSAPTTNLCSAGTASSVSEDRNSWKWTCSNGSDTVTCSASKSACAIAGNCTVGNCGNFNGKTFDPSTDLTSLLKFEDPQASDPDFCVSNTGDTMLSYNPSIDSKEFTWYCGTSECHAYLKFPNKGVIKIYGAYSGSNVIPCPECIGVYSGFDAEKLDNGSIVPFISDYDTSYTRSVMSGDYLPFGWVLPKSDDYVATCDASNVGKFNKNAVKVRFKLEKADGTVVYTTPEYNGFNSGVLKAFPDNSVAGQAYIPVSEIKKLPNGLNKIYGYIDYQQKCESYTDSAGNISYHWVGISTSIPIATQTFTKTDHYMVQLNPMSSSENTNISFNGQSLTSILQSNGYIIPQNPINYDTGDLSKILSGFIAKYKEFANLCGVSFKGTAGYDLCKIPTEEVYYKTGNIVLNEGLHFSVPTTLIVEDGDVTVRPNITGPFMLVVKNGKIKIENQNMNTRSVLDGYYITDKGFEVFGPAGTSSIYNTNPNQKICDAGVCKYYRFSDGRLQVNGVLIGPNANKIFKNRRSILKNYFRAEYGPSWAIANGASLQINSNPDLWTNPPVGSKDLFQMLKVGKGY